MSETLQTPRFRLSVLDTSPVVKGATASTALRNTIELAKHTENLGYTRYWLAEHHNSPTLASSAPEILIGYVASATREIRVGSGGIMLPNHAPLKVAEGFRLLQAMHPGRIDLGIGRAPGTDGRTALALRRSMEAMIADDFPEQMHDLLGFLYDDLEPNHPFAGIKAAPVGVEPPDIWMLGSSDFGGAVAAQIGSGFAFAHHINPEPAVAVLRAYREQFKPSRLGAAPKSILAVAVICADTEEQANHIAGSMDLFWVQLRGGRPGALVSAAEAAQYPWTYAEQIARQQSRQRYFVGAPDQVHQRIEQLAQAAGVDEIMIMSMAYDENDRRRSYELLAEAFDLTPRHAAIQAAL